MGYGNDKQSKIFNLYTKGAFAFQLSSPHMSVILTNGMRHGPQGAFFVVLPDSYQIHQWHPQSKIWSGPCGKAKHP